MKFDTGLNGTNWTHWKDRTLEALTLLNLMHHVLSDVSAVILIQPSTHASPLPTSPCGTTTTGEMQMQLCSEAV